MNTYRHTFSARCPRNGESIIFNLSIQTGKMIYVEHIKTACGMLREGYHEHIAASLHEQFGGQLTLTANHHGVDIETVLGAVAKESSDADKT